MAKAEALTPTNRFDRDNRPAPGTFAHWLADRKNRRLIPHRFEQCGYSPVRNDTAKDGLWKVNGARQVVYGLSSLSVRDRLAAAARVRDRDGETALELAAAVSEVGEVSENLSACPPHTYTRADTRDLFVKNGDFKQSPGCESNFTDFTDSTDRPPAPRNPPT